MKELLLVGEQKEINSTGSLKSSTSNTFTPPIDEHDELVYETFKYIRVKSCYKKRFLKMLAILYKHQIIIIFLSFLIGIIFFAIPMIFIYIKFFTNRALPLFFICLFGILFSVLSIIIHCLDSKRYNYMLSEKPERKNLFKNIGNIFLFLLLTVSVFFGYLFYIHLFDDKDDKIKFDYNSSYYSYDSEVLSTDFIFKYIIYSLLIDSEKIKDIKNRKIKMIFWDWDMDRLRNDLIYVYIPLVIITFFYLIKIFIIEVRQTVEKVLFYGGVFTLLSFQCFINSNAIKNLKGKNLLIASIFQNVLIIIIFLGYILWNLNYTLLLIKRRKDNNFAIRRLKNYFIYIIIIIDIITCLGYGIVTLSLLYCFISFNFHDNQDNEDFQHLYTSLIIFKAGFFPIIFGNSYYFGYYFLAMIFRPLAHYAPYRLKNNHYVKFNRKLWNFTSLKERRRKMSIKLKKVIQ